LAHLTEMAVTLTTVLHYHTAHDIIMNISQKCKTQNTCDKCRLLGSTITSGDDTVTGEELPVPAAAVDETAVVHNVLTTAFVTSVCHNKTSITLCSTN